jgi:hypothetical protein
MIPNENREINLNLNPNLSYHDHMRVIVDDGITISMKYTTIVVMRINGKIVTFFLKEGEDLSIDNIVDVAIEQQDEQLNEKFKHKIRCDI